MSVVPVFKPVAIGSATSNRHQNDAVIAAEAEVHTLLKARALSSAHFNVRNNFVGHILGQRL
jgi:hypothetical protein